MLTSDKWSSFAGLASLIIEKYTENCVYFAFFGWLFERERAKKKKTKNSTHFSTDRFCAVLLYSLPLYSGENKNKII